MTAQLQLGIFSVAPADPNVDWLVRTLEHSDWLLAGDILLRAGRDNTEANRRWLRALAKASKGRVAGGQRGYKLVGEMTRDEYQAWRNWMKSQADEMTARILEADKVWYTRQPVATGQGILETTK